MSTFDPWCIIDVPMSGMEEGRAHGVDLLTGQLDPAELIGLIPPVTSRAARAALEVLAGDFV